MTPAIIYAAKSTQDRHDSIPTQLTEAREMCEENGWTIVAEYADENFSAYSGNRGKGLAQAEQHAARAAAEHDTIAMLVTQAHDRFARGAGDKPGAPQSLGELWHRTRRLNVHLRTVEDDEELRDEASVAAIGRRAHIDSKRKAKSVAKGHKRRRGRGGYHGGPEPFGLAYPRDDSGRTLPDQPLRHDVQAKQAARIFQLVQDGLGQNAIARQLARDGVPTSAGGEWRGGTVRRILTNPLYAGRAKDGTELGHEPIVDWETFQKVQAILSSRKRGPGKGGRPHRGLFTHGHLRCGQCGGAMGWRSRRAGYLCTTRELDPERCSAAIVDGPALEAAVLHELERRRQSQVKAEEAWRTSNDADLAHVATLAAEAEREHERALAALARVKADYTSGEITAAEWRELRSDLEEGAAATAAQAEQLRRREQAMRAKGGPEVAERFYALLATLGELAGGALEGTVGRAEVREALRYLFPVLTLRTQDAKMWVDLGDPAPEVIKTLVDDELQGREGEPILERLGLVASTEPLGLTSVPVLAPIAVEL